MNCNLGFWELSDAQFKQVCDVVEFKPDSDGYPLQPNGDVSFRFTEVRKGSNLESRFSNWVWFHQTDNKKKFIGNVPILYMRKTCQGRKTFYFICIGILKCRRCGLMMRPRTKEHKLKAKLICLKCKKDGLLDHLPCPATFKMEFLQNGEHYNGRCVVTHNGFHNHTVPPAKMAPTEAKSRLEAMIKCNPNAKPAKLLHGGVMDTPTAGDIHSSFQHSDRLRYLRRSILLKYNIKTATSDSILDLLDFQAHVGSSIVVSESISFPTCHISIQTPQMKKWLIDSSDEGRTIKGIVSDVTFDFFQVGYLLSSSVYCALLERWVPVLGTWIRTPDEGCMKPHFSVLVG
jgi:hypothetical protein